MLSNARFVVVVVAAGLLGFAAVGSVASAAADPVDQQNSLETDDQFIWHLQESGIPAPSRREAIPLAHSVCDVISDGIDPSGAAAATADFTGLDMHESSVFVHLSVLSYCPQYAGLVDGA